MSNTFSFSVQILDHEETSNGSYIGIRTLTLGSRLFCSMKILFTFFSSFSAFLGVLKPFLWYVVTLSVLFLSDEWDCQIRRELAYLLARACSFSSALRISFRNLYISQIIPQVSNLVQSLQNARAPSCLSLLFLGITCGL